MDIFCQLQLIFWTRLPGVTKAAYHSLFLVYRLHFFLTTELR